MRFGSSKISSSFINSSSNEKLELRHNISSRFLMFWLSNSSLIMVYQFFKIKNAKVEDLLIDRYFIKAFSISLISMEIYSLIFRKNMKVCRLIVGLSKITFWISLFLYLSSISNGIMLSKTSIRKYFTAHCSA